MGNLIIDIKKEIKKDKVKNLLIITNILIMVKRFFKSQYFIQIS